MTETRTEPLKILVGCDTFTPNINGAARFAERLAAGLVERGHDVHIAAPAATFTTHGRYREVVEGQEMTVHRLPSWRLLMHEWVRFVLPWRVDHYVRQLLDSVQPDVIHIQSHIIIGRALSKEAKKRGIRLIATNHVMPENIVDLWSMPLWLRRLCVKWGWHDADSVLRRADGITTPTRRAADFLERSTPRTGVLPVSCGLDASQYVADLSERTEKRVVFVGRMTQEKHVDVLLRAVARLDAEVGLDLVGPGDQLPALEKLASELGVRERVVFHGRASDETLRATLTKGSVFAIASIAELQSIATMEAMASGLPIVAANAMALPHLVTVGQNGFLFEPRDDAELATHLKHILSLPHEEFQAMQKASLEAVKVHDINNTLDRFEELYRG
ncbi:glycosyltransferase [Canibacter zhoujuaniae]|uniref:glycosyltransferase n=1 Tax=Canibacter zhoujuaniae TaxID=2708343 RepID=UPI00141FD870|nr:glycosyltransferase [Canibacter zhoujuaniae]